MQRRRSNRGFSLVEMIVAVSIISMLMAMLLPALQSARTSARSTVCKNHLHQIGRAYGEFRLARPKPTRADRWTIALSPYLEDTSRVFYCPEGRTDSAGTPPYVIVIDRRSGTAPRTIVCEPGPLCRRTDRADGSYVLGFDSGYYSLDYNDVLLLVEEHEDGVNADVTLLSHDTNGNIAVQIYNSGGQLLVDASFDPNDQIGTSVTVQMKLSASYGMNEASELMTADDHKVLVLDYKRTVARVVGPDYIDDWPLEVAPRHFDTCNVLRVGGAVQAMSPSELNPAVPESNRLWWQPIEVEKSLSGM